MDDIKVKLDLLKQIPEEFLEMESPKNIRQVFANPTLIHIEGESKEALFVSALLHGNETTSFFAVQKIAKKIKDQNLKRSLIIFIGNVFAAEKGERHLENQNDYNRIWKEAKDEEEELVKGVRSYLKDQELFAAVDIHNNSGKNPLYGCVVNTGQEHLYLASLFSKTVVYFENPDSVLIHLTRPKCPSVVLECGQSGNTDGIEKATNLINDLLHISSLQSHDDIHKSVTVYHTVGRIVINEEHSISFSGDADIVFKKDLTNYNFTPLEKGFVIGTSKKENPLKVYGDNNEDLTDSFIQRRDEQILLNKNSVPAMLTEDLCIAKNDCLGYLMDEYKNF